MQDYPHRYKAAAQGAAEGVIDTGSPGLESIPAMPPPEFDGPGDKWSPETLLVASVANCFILTFRAVARASKFEWSSLTVEVDGVLDRIERQHTGEGAQIRAREHVDVVLVALGHREVAGVGTGAGDNVAGQFGPGLRHAERRHDDVRAGGQGIPGALFPRRR